MRKLNLGLLALLSFVSFAFTSCSEEETGINYVSYVADFSVSAVGGGLEALEVVSWGLDYNEAIADLMGISGLEDDDAVIKVCDAVYAKHKASPAYKYATGEVKINKYRGLLSNPDQKPRPERVIETYTYNN